MSEVNGWERHGAKLDGNSAERLVASAIWSQEGPRFLGIVYYIQCYTDSALL